MYAELARQPVFAHHLHKVQGTAFCTRCLKLTCGCVKEGVRTACCRLATTVRSQRLKSASRPIMASPLPRSAIDLAPGQQHI